PKSKTASFTQNWALDMPDDNFLHEIVNRWRQQTFNPGSADYTVETATAPAPAASEPPAPPPLRRQLGLGPQTQGPRPTLAPGQPGERGESGHHRTAQPAGVPMAGQFPAPPPPPKPPEPSLAKESLA